MAEAGAGAGVGANSLPPDAVTGACARRLKDAGAAHEELRSGFNDWSGSLATTGRYTVYAVIAANWAVHGAARQLLHNELARWSMIVAVAYVAIHLVCVGVMTLLYRAQCEYADADRTRWEGEFRANANKASAWPYTDAIQGLGEALRWLHVFAPLVSGALLIASMYFG